MLAIVLPVISYSVMQAFLTPAEISDFNSRQADSVQAVARVDLRGNTLKCKTPSSGDEKEAIIQVTAQEIGNPDCKDPEANVPYSSTSVADYGITYTITNVSDHKIEMDLLQAGFHCPEPYGYTDEQYNYHYICGAKHGEAPENWRLRNPLTDISLLPGKTITLTNTIQYNSKDTNYAEACGSYQIDITLSSLTIYDTNPDRSYTYVVDPKDESEMGLTDNYGGCEGFGNTWTPIAVGLCHTGVQCENAPVCGNGELEGNEQCETGDPNYPADDCSITSGNSCQYCDISGGTCIIKTKEKAAPVCGDGKKEGNEACDDGNTINGDGCDSQCHKEYCGDNITQKRLGEECDDGNRNNNDSCTNSCQPARCGDGYKQPGEACDDGNNDNDDSCTNTCALPTCGDGIKQNGEECDDGNQNNNDSCTNTCLLAQCGDGYKQPGEACDDGNTENNDGCSSTCQLESCGDGVKQTSEACDDGANNGKVCTINGVGSCSYCTSSCTIQTREVKGTTHTPVDTGLGEVLRIAGGGLMLAVSLLTLSYAVSLKMIVGKRH